MSRLATFCLFFVLFGQLCFNAIFYYLHISGVATLVWGCLYLFAANKMARNAGNARFTEIDLLFGACMAYVLFDYLILGESSAGAFYSSFAMFMVGPYFCGRAMGNFFTPDKLRYLYAFAAVMLFLMLFEFARDPSLLSQERLQIFRPEGDARTIAGATDFYIASLYCSTFLVIFLFLILAPKELKPRGIRRIGLYLLAFVSFVIAAVWGSRGGLLALMAVSGMVLLRHVSFRSPKTYLVIVALILFVVGGYYALPPTRQELIQEIPAGLAALGDAACVISGDSVLAHITLYREGIRLFSESPLFGVGASNFGLHFCGDTIEMGGPHSTILHLLSEYGLVGALIWSLWFFSVVLTFKRADRRYEGEQKLMLRIIFLLWLYEFLALQTSGNLYVDYQPYIFTGMLATMTFRRKTLAREAPAGRAAGRPGAILPQL
ncbi:MAG TPA: O-antigen ligase family protein [Rhizomicrobium sp.]|nr:O-antigen ligase family protein [Rhizomicrobium sp.]